MPVPYIWDEDLNMLKLVVELQVSHNGTFPLDMLMDKVGLLDRGDSYLHLTPWKVTESLRRLAEDGTIILLSNSLLDDDDDDGDDDYLKKLGREWEDTDNEKREREIEEEVARYEQERPRQIERRRRRVEEAFFKGKAFEDVYWREGRFYKDGALQVCELRSTPMGLRRAGAWPNPDRFNENLIAILIALAESIEKEHPKDASKLREVISVVRSNVLELSAALVAKLLEHAAGI
jgi:hypothetical protein